MTDRPILRHWCAECRYIDRAKFLLGTVQAESELQALAALKSLWAKLSPHPAPDMVPLPGMLALLDEDELKRRGVSA